MSGLTLLLGVIAGFLTGILYSRLRGRPGKTRGGKRGQPAPAVCVQPLLDLAPVHLLGGPHDGLELCISRRAEVLLLDGQYLYGFIGRKGGRGGICLIYKHLHPTGSDIIQTREGPVGYISKI